MDAGPRPWFQTISSFLLPAFGPLRPAIQATPAVGPLAQALKDNAELTFRVNETRSRVAALVERLPKDEADAEGSAQ